MRSLGGVSGSDGAADSMIIGFALWFSTAIAMDCKIEVEHKSQPNTKIWHMNHLSPPDFLILKNH